MSLLAGIVTRNVLYAVFFSGNIVPEAEKGLRINFVSVQHQSKAQCDAITLHTQLRLHDQKTKAIYQ